MGLQGVRRRYLKGREAASACGSGAAGGVPSTDSVAESRSKSNWSPVRLRLVRGPGRCVRTAGLQWEPRGRLARAEACGAAAEGERRARSRTARPVVQRQRRRRAGGGRRIRRAGPACRRRRRGRRGDGLARSMGQEKSWAEAWAAGKKKGKGSG